MSRFEEMPSGPAGSLVHQIVFRWEGNQGRQGTGMKAVAHSCPTERAEELGRELGPLLWVSGRGAVHPSVVRTLSRDGEVLLVQRWPTKDPNGRPSTVSHVLMGGPDTLRTPECLGLSYGGWGTRDSAERAKNTQSTLDGAKLGAYARKHLPEMRDRLESVQHALILATAEWLRDPAQRVSLLVEEDKPSGWPGRDETPLVYLGLYLLFGTWPGHEWTFATYDTVDTHPLRLMSVPRWEQDTGGGPGPLARVTGRRTPSPRFEHHAAARLVEHLLAHREAPPGVPQLMRELSGGATTDWARRRDLLQKILGGDRRSGGVRPETPERRYEEPQYEKPRHEEPQYQEPQYEEPKAPYAHRQNHHHPHLALQLHEDLCGHERANHVQRSFLMAQLRDLPDEVLLRELRSDELPPDSVELLLSELGNHQRRETRPLEMQHALCAHMLHNHLYLPPPGQTEEPLSRTALAVRAADLFNWAVAPVARDGRHLHGLYELLHTLSRAPHPIESNWLAQSIISPANGEIPDLPPTVWHKILSDQLTRPDNRPQQTNPPPRPPLAPESPEPMSRFSELMTTPGCVIGACVAVMVVLIVIGLIVV